jgi:glycosyltransferase involved in cell wall biosynthesis
MSHKNLILIDFEKIKDPYSGLGQFLKHLKIYFDKSKLNLRYFNPDKFQKVARHISFFVPNCGLFHAIHQDSPYIPFGPSTKYVLTIHDLNSLTENKDAIFQKNYRTKLQNKINRATAITFISHFTRIETEKLFNLGHKKTFVIYNGISLPSESATPQYIPSKKYIFTIGTVVPKKNFHVLIDMMKYLPDYELIIAGTLFHQYAKDMQAKVINEKLEERIRFVGTISDEEKLWYYQHANSFVLPSLLEGFGLPVAEAMSLGLPLFLSDKTSLPEIGGKDAYYFYNFDGANMAEEFLKGIGDFNEEKKARLMERSKLFNWEKAAEKYLEIYQSFL